jgi:signal transduction histidine kinase
MRSVRLEQLIFGHYARSALVPIVTIELLLLVIYFGVNAWTARHTESTLEVEVQQVVPHLVAQETETIDAQLRQIELQTRYFAQEHEDLLANPANHEPSGEAPAYTTAPTGAWVQTNRKEWSSLYFTHAARLTEAQKRKATLTAFLDPLYRHVVKDTPNVVSAYFNTYDDMNRLYPFIDKVWEQYPPDLNMEDYNFYYLADAAHNPERKAVWTGVYLDPAGHGWLLSCVAPVYVAGKLEGVVGIDVTVENIVQNILRQTLPWGASAFLSDDSGTILAMSPAVEGLLGLEELKAHVYKGAVTQETLKPEQFNLLKNPNPDIGGRFQEVFRSADTLHDLTLRGRNVFLVQDRIPVTGWRLFAVVEEAEVFKSISEVTSLTHQIGLAIVALMLLFYFAFFAILRRRARRMAVEMASPIKTLTEATRAVATSEAKGAIALSGITEFDSLTDTFNQMSEQLDTRSQQLVQTRVHAEVQSKEAELAFARGMYESASGYLHNVGNFVTRLEGSLMDLSDVIRSTTQYPAVFAKIRPALEGRPEAAVLARFEAVLIEKTVPRLETCITQIRGVADVVQQTIQQQQQDFRDSRQQIRPSSFDLADLVRQAVNDFVPTTGAITVELEAEGGVPVTSHRNQVRNGVANVVKNAVEAMNGAGVLKISVARTGTGGRVTVTDDGSGVAPEHVERLFTAGFTTKATGTGLGLHSFAVFLASNGGQVTLHSDGPGQGATAAIDVGDVAEVPHV